MLEVNLNDPTEVEQEEANSEPEFSDDSFDEQDLEELGPNDA